MVDARSITRPTRILDYFAVQPIQTNYFEVNNKSCSKLNRWCKREVNCHGIISLFTLTFDQFSAYLYTFFWHKHVRITVRYVKLEKIPHLETVLLKVRH